MSEPAFIDDGYTRTDHLPARPGLYPACEIVYRPALPKERVVYAAKLDTRDPEKIDTHQVELIARYGVSVNGESLKDRERVKRLEPNVRGRLIDLILGYEPARAEEDAGNSPGA